MKETFLRRISIGEQKLTLLRESEWSAVATLRGRGGCAQRARRGRLINGLHTIAARKNARERNRRRQVAEGHGQANIITNLPWVQGPQPQRRAAGLDIAAPCLLPFSPSPSPAPLSTQVSVAQAELTIRTRYQICAAAR